MKKSMVIYCLLRKMSCEVVAALLLLSIFSAAFPNESGAYPAGMVSYWQFNEGSGNTANDSVGTNNGTIVGASWDNSGLVNGALRFDGINDSVTLPNIMGLGNFTMSVWFRTSTKNDSTIFQTGMGDILFQYQTAADGSASYHYLIHSNRQGGDGSQNGYREDVYHMQFEDKWHFAIMTATADNSELKAYMDGQFLGNLTWASTGLSALLNYTTIGALRGSLFPGGEAYHYSGLIDEVAVFDRALTTDEIGLYYQTGLNGQDLSAVPEPATMLLLASGLAGLAGFRKRFRKN